MNFNFAVKGEFGKVLDGGKGEFTQETKGKGVFRGKGKGKFSNGRAKLMGAKEENVNRRKGLPLLQAGSGILRKGKRGERSSRSWRGSSRQTPGQLHEESNKGKEEADLARAAKGGKAVYLLEEETWWRLQQHCWKRGTSQRRRA